MMPKSRFWKVGSFIVRFLGNSSFVIVFISAGASKHQSGVIWWGVKSIRRWGFKASGERLGLVSQRILWISLVGPGVEVCSESTCRAKDSSGTTIDVNCEELQNACAPNCVLGTNCVCVCVFVCVWETALYIRMESSKMHVPKSRNTIFAAQSKTAGRSLLTTSLKYPVCVLSFVLCCRFVERESVFPPTIPLPSCVWPTCASLVGLTDKLARGLRTTTMFVGAC
jgi:hypothetical protein